MPGSSGAGQQERRLQHHPVDLREALGVELLDRRDVLDAGVVDEHVDARGRPRPSASIDVASERSATRCSPPTLGGDLLGAGLVAVEEQDGCAVGGEPGGDGAADAAGRAGDQGGAAGQEVLASCRGTLRGPRSRTDHVCEHMIEPQIMCPSVTCPARSRTICSASCTSSSAGRVAPVRRRAAGRPGRGAG